MWFESQPCKSINFELEYPLIKVNGVTFFPKHEIKSMKM